MRDNSYAVRRNQKFDLTRKSIILKKTIRALAPVCLFPSDRVSSTPWEARSSSIPCECKEYLEKPLDQVIKSCFFYLNFT